MYDRFNRQINYLRISVTDRCNLRCTYCMPEEGITQIDHSEILSFEEIASFTRIAATKGFNKVRITGGEPLVRKGVVELVSMISNIEGITDLSMTTNGVLLGKYAKELKYAGLQRVNVSLDTVNPTRYRQITRVGSLDDVLNGLECARAAGLTPIKINCVVDKSSAEPDAVEVKKFAQANGFEVRFIPKMDLNAGIFGEVEGGNGGNCSICNRLRLTANGFVKPCLFSNLGYSVRGLGYEGALLKAVNAKPARGTTNHDGKFYNIGG